MSATPGWATESDQTNAEFGYSVGTAEDLNGDGYADVIVGSHQYNHGQPAEGRAFVYYGNDGPGLSLKPQQRRHDDSTPIAKGGTPACRTGSASPVSTGHRSGAAG